MKTRELIRFKVRRPFGEDFKCDIKKYFINRRYSNK